MRFPTEREHEAASLRELVDAYPQGARDLRALGLFKRRTWSLAHPDRRPVNLVAPRVRTRSHSRRLPRIKRAVSHCCMKVGTQIDGTGQCQSMLPNVQKNVLYDLLCQGYGFEVVKSVAAEFARVGTKRTPRKPVRHFDLDSRQTDRPPPLGPDQRRSERGAALRLPSRLRPAPIVKEEWPTHRVRLSGERYSFRANILVHRRYWTVWQNAVDRATEFSQC